MPKNVVPFKITDEDTGNSWDIFIPVELNRIAPYHFISSNWNWSIGQAEGHENTWFGYPGDYTSNPSSMMSYNVSDLQENFIEVSRDYEIKGDISGGVKAKTVKFGDQMTIIMSLWREAVSTSPLVEIYSMCFTGPTNTVFNAAASRSPSLQAAYPKTLTGIPDEVLAQRKPALSFHICNYRWEAGYYDPQNVPVLIVNYWTWANEGSSEEPNWVYKVEYQWCMSATYAFGDGEITPIDVKPASKTPNATPNGGWGNRSNISANVPMPSVDDLNGFSKYAAGNQSGVHLYRINPTNWAALEGELWNPDVVGKIAQSINRGLITGSQNLDQFIISAVRIGLPVNLEGILCSVTVGNLDFLEDSPYGLISAVALSNRFAETDTYDFIVPYYSETFLDFDPMTKIQMHLPYCGIMSISADACMGGMVQVKYIVDLISAECTAIVRTIDQFGNTRIAGCMSGKCGVAIPFLTNQLNQEKIAGSIGSVVTGLATGSIGGIAKGSVGLLGTEADLMNSTKVSDSSTVGGMSAIMADICLYLAIFHPQDMTGLQIDGSAQVDNFGNKVGYTAACFSKINAFANGAYVEAEINPNAIHTATDAEKEAIKNIIKRGVYI